MKAKSWVVNQFIDLLLCQDIAVHGLEKLNIAGFDPICVPFEEDIMSRLA